MGAILSTILPGLPPPLCNEGASTTDTYKFESKKPLQQRQWPYVRGADQSHMLGGLSALCAGYR
jgi:hypothetical protein